MKKVRVLFQYKIVFLRDLYKRLLCVYQRFYTGTKLVFISQQNSKLSIYAFKINVTKTIRYWNFQFKAKLAMRCLKRSSKAQFYNGNN